MNEKKLSIVLPIYNEEKSIKKTILEWKNELDLLKIDYEIILAEDGSDDNTKNILFELINDDKNKIYLNNIVEKKRGYAGAIISSVKIANGEFILYADSDGQCSPKDFINFWNKKEFISEGIIIGNRKTRADTLFRLIMSKSFKIIHRILFYSKVKDPSCPYVLCRKKTFLELEKYLIYMVEGFGWGFVAACIKTKKNILEIDIDHKKRNEGKTNVFHLNEIPSIAIRNTIGLLRIKLI